MTFFFNLKSKVVVFSCSNAIFTGQSSLSYIELIGPEHITALPVNRQLILTRTTNALKSLILGY